MEQDIQKMQAWKRTNMPNAGGARAYMIQTHQVHYYDQLLKDMGANIRRKKGNPFTRAVKEIFDPYRPRDYSSIVTGEYKYRPNETISRQQASFAKEGFVFLSGAYGLYLVGIIFVDGLKSRYGDIKVCSIFMEGLKLWKG